LADVDLQTFLDRVPFAGRRSQTQSTATIPVPAKLPVPAQKTISTQAGFGLILNELGREDTLLAQRIVTTSPDVTVSTNLGAWVNRRGLFAEKAVADLFKNERIPSTFTWEFSPKGQHFELGIAESNLFTLLSALGLSHSLFGERLLPIGTVYDPFIYRGADALNYACYQDARFLLVATPSGVTLAPEGGAHQSIGTPLIGMAQDGLSYFEPAFVDELAVVMRWAFEHMQRDGKNHAGSSWPAEASGGSVYLRLSSRVIEQPSRAMTDVLERDIINGAYWMRRPGPNAEAVIVYTGALAPEAIHAVGLLGESRRDIGLLAITSSDRLHAAWAAAQTAREKGHANAQSHIETLLAELPSNCALITVVDAHPATLGWLGAVRGHRTRALGVDRFGQTGTLGDLYRHYGIDAEGIMRAVQMMAPGRPLRHLHAATI
jgi:pyruvate dehydrogenase E1 component